MLKKKSIIVFLSTLVFIFPLIYQPMHVVLHHGEHHEHKEGLSTTPYKCLAYEYQFATYDLPEQLIVEVNEIEIHSTQNSFYKDFSISEKVLNTASRAPPALS